MIVWESISHVRGVLAAVTRQGDRFAVWPGPAPDPLPLADQTHATYEEARLVGREIANAQLRSLSGGLRS